eukprot:scaffold20361_cov102-Isochrysis_galbana.AAC.4
MTSLHPRAAPATMRRHEHLQASPGRCREQRTCRWLRVASPPGPRWPSPCLTHTRSPQSRRLLALCPPRPHSQSPPAPHPPLPWRDRLQPPRPLSFGLFASRSPPRASLGAHAPQPAFFRQNLLRDLAPALAPHPPAPPRRAGAARAAVCRAGARHTPPVALWARDPPALAL